MNITLVQILIILSIGKNWNRSELILISWYPYLTKIIPAEEK